ncbi:MAG: patatin family protein [Erysipelotrichales bacterium]|nr:patatin family protein [Erysipelotrichales bacterium]
MKFSQPIVKGTKHTKMLPKGTALILEGGGTRGFYSSGVLDAFMEEGIMFPYIIGVSAGTANALSYVSGQKGRNRTIVEHYVGNHRYVSKRNLIKHRSLFGYDFIFKTVPKKHLFWDQEVFEETDIKLLTGAINCQTGSTVWFEKDELGDNFQATRASCSVPIVARIVEYNGLKLLDGGISDPIPIEKSIADGNTFHVIVLTQNQGYIKTAFKQKRLIKLMYRKYPALVEAIIKRHDIYNRQLALCENLERENKALIIRPLKPLSVDRTTRNIDKLLELYDEGQVEGAVAIKKLMEYLNK